MRRFGIFGLFAIAALLVALVARLVLGHNLAPWSEFITVHVDTNGHDLAETYVVDREEPTPDSVYPTIPSYSVICNTGASGSQEFDLPPAAAGLRFTFVCTVAQNIVVDPVAGDQILSLTNATGDSITAGTIGNAVTLVAIDSTNWVAVSLVGSWADTN